MARRPAREEIADEIADETSPEMRTLALIDGLLNEEGGAGGIKILVKELVDVPGKRNPSEMWLFDAQPDELDDLRRRLLEECGPGSYRVRVLGPDRKQVAQYDVAVAKPKRVRDAERVAALNPRVVPATDERDRVLLERLDKMEQNQKSTADVLQALAARLLAPPAAAASPLQSVKETVEIMGAMSALIPKPDANIGLSMFNQGLDMAKKIYEMRGAGGGDDDGEEGGFSSLLDKVLNSPVVAGLVASLPKPNNGAPAGAAAAPALEPLRVPGAAPDAEPSPIVGGAELAAAMNHLIVKASENVSPALMVDYVKENMPDSIWQMMQSAQDPIGELAKLFPAVVTYRPWFDSLLDKLDEAGNTGGQAGRHDVPRMQPGA